LNNSFTVTITGSVQLSIMIQIDPHLAELNETYYYAVYGIQSV